jgi:two-component system response regulator
LDSKAILLVEDNQADEDLAILALKKNKFRNDVVVARDGAEALDYLFGTGSYASQEAPRLPAMILLDLKLPKISGLEVLKRVRSDERTKLVPIVILTSSKEEVDLISGYSLGANSYIRKPVDFKEFNEVIRQMGSYWLAINEPPPEAF